MRNRITIHIRSITAPVFDSASSTETYNDGIDEWAFIETPGDMGNVVNEFSEVNMPAGTTHMMTIRFDSTFTAQNIIRWEGDAYKILKVEDPDKRQQYLTFYTQIKGDKTLAANT